MQPYEFDESMLAKYQAQTAIAGETMGLGAEIVHGAVAAVADFGTSVWNSTAGMVNEDLSVSTADLLSRIDKDALQVYNEHPDAVHTASLIGGVFVPAGLAFKGMIALRAGQKGVSWFSKAGETARLAEVESAFAKSTAGASEALNLAKTSMYKAMAANVLVDNAAAEAAIVLTMNAHPYMEDYMNDLPSNFLLGVAIGGGVGGVVGTISTRAQIRAALSPIAREAEAFISKGEKFASEGMNLGDQLQVREMNIKMWESKLAAHKDGSGKQLNHFTQAYLEHTITANKAMLVEDFQKMAKGKLAEAPQSVKDSVIDLTKSDSRFIHADEISYLEIKKDYVAPKTRLGMFVEDYVPSFFTKGTTKAGDEVTSANKLVFSREQNRFLPLSEAGDHAVLADFTTDVEVLKKVSPQEFRNARLNVFLDRQAMATHEIAADEAKAFFYVDSLPFKEIAKHKVQYDDMSMLRALTARVQNVKEGESVADFSVTLVGKEGSPMMVGGLKEVQSFLVQAELRMAEGLKKAGTMSDEAIAKRVGVSSLDQAGKGMARYTSEPQILLELAETNKSLVVGTNLNKVPFAELRSSLSARNLDDMNSELIDAVLRSSDDPLVRGLREEVFTEESRFLARELLKGVDAVNNVDLRSTMFRSANSAVESFGTAGTIATRIGQDVTHYINKAKEALVAPISQKMKDIVDSEALVVETNMAMTVNASISGPRVYRDGQFWVKELRRQADGTEKMMEVAVKYKGQEFKIVSKEVLDLFDAFQTAGRSMYALNNSVNKILGKPKLPDIGFWIPAFNPRNKEIAYVVEHTHGRPTTSILWGKTSAELNDKIQMFEAQAKNEGRNVTVLSKDKNLEHFNKIQGREDPMAMQVADISLQHTGSSANALISTNVELLNEVINSYDHLIAKGITNLVDIQLAPVMDRLQRISERSQILHNEKSFGVIQKAVSSKADPGMVMRNILLGKGLISEHTTWLSTQQGLQVFTDMALENLAKATQPLVNTISKGHGRTEESFAQLNAELKAKGLMPFEAVEDFIRYQQEGHIVSTSLTPRAVALSNALAATTLLRFMELAQPLVNAISLPILTSGAVRKQMAAEFMGAKLTKNPHFTATSVMYDGARFMNTVEGQRWLTMGEKRGLYTPMVSEANAAMAQARSLDPGIMAKAEAALESSFVKMLSKPADLSEEMVRKYSFMNGVILAKKAYPGLNDTGVMTFARSFMDEALGNYSAAQRPAFFQGTFGVAMGIFQTYMLTLAQQLYRGIEARDWVGLSKQMFTQATIFGGSALPGFHLVSEQIGSHFSENHVDLETGLFRAIDDDAATTILYGLPSSLGMGITTRGDIQPRVPNPLMGLDTLAAVNLTRQAWEAGKGITEAAFTADASTGRAMLEALSVQSISRPLARWSELVTGRSMTSAGVTVASNTTGNPFSEEFVLHGALARIMATRPIEEVKAREAMHLDSVYNSVDGDKRKEITKRLRTYIQDGNLTPEAIQELQYDYLSTGSPTGWRAAVNDALRVRVMGGDFAVKDRLHPNAPYMQMVDGLD